MKKITVIGMGLGSDTLTFEASDAISRAEVLIGAPRMLEMASVLHKNAPKRCYQSYLPKDIADAVFVDGAERFAVLVSGDVGFYSAAMGISNVLTDYEVEFLPGVSTVNAFFARLKLPWQEAAFISVHGREANIVDTVRRNRLVFCLTGGNVNDIGAALTEASWGYVKTFAGENLGAESERVREITVADLTDENFPAMTVLLFQNEEADDRIPFGLPDSRFLRLKGIPMSKSETRAIVMSKLNIYPSDICYDIGAGTGSVSVEMALSAYRGHIYAVERREDAVPFIKQNCASFHLGNVTVICGEAPAALEKLPVPDAAFIGGNGGELSNIIDTVLAKNPNVRIVITAVTLETVSTALAALKSAGLDLEITQISAARSKRVGEFHMMEPQSPITVFAAGGIHWRSRCRNVAGHPGRMPADQPANERSEREGKP